MAYKAADAKRKKKGDTGKKYSSPTRTNVSTVVLRSDIPTSNANRTAAKTTAAKRTDPSPRVTTQSVTKPTRFNALNTNVEERPKAQTLLYTGEQSTRSAGKTLNTPQRKFSSDYEGVRKNADYKTGAAYGWRAYREDEERKQQLKRSSSYQRWTQAVGDKPTLQGSADTKPQRNWTIDQNNTFGYLYNSRDESNARESARLVNAENLAKVREAGQKAWQSVKDGQTRLANASYQQSEIQADWLKEVGKTLQSYYTDGVRKSADNQAITAQKQTDGWKTILDSIGQSASNLHNANYQQSKTQVEKVTEIGHSAWKNMGGCCIRIFHCPAKQCTEIGRIL